jgi:hypothetical protein
VHGFNRHVQLTLQLTLKWQGNHWFHQPAAKWSSFPFGAGSVARTPPGSQASLRSSFGRSGGSIGGGDPFFGGASKSQLKAQVLSFCAE